VTALLADWWAYPSTLRLREIGRDRVSALAPEKRPGRKGLFFSCGVDSLDSLFRLGDEVDDLILVHGFDVPLADRERFAALARQADEIARGCQKRLVVVRTNLREHRGFQKGGWVRNHGAALVAVGALMREEYERLYISASYPSESLEPWGSHPLLDHLWTKGWLDIRHVGDDAWRLEKMDRNRKEERFAKNLVVCWRGKGEPLNCGRCEKCVRNQLGLLMTGHTGGPTNFPNDIDLVEAIDRLPVLANRSSVYTYALNHPALREEVRNAVERLFERSRSNRAEDPGAVASTGTQPGWEQDSLRARIADPVACKRHQAASPDEEEIAAYADALPSVDECRDGTAIVLGMTPELREMAARRFKAVVAVDRSRAAIELYRDWLAAELRAKEKIFSADWMHLRFIDFRGLPPVRAVLGDGIIANLPDIEAHGRFLDLLALRFPEAIMVFRKALAVFDFPDDSTALAKLREDFRLGRIGADAFGLGVRLQAFLHSFYDVDRAILDNRSIFRECARLAEKTDGLTQAEWAAIRPFRFDGPNCLVRREVWEGLLVERGFEFSARTISGKPWSRYYPIYRLKPPGRRSADPETAGRSH